MHGVTLRLRRLAILRMRTSFGARLSATTTTTTTAAAAAAAGAARATSHLRLALVDQILQPCRSQRRPPFQRALHCVKRVCATGIVRAVNHPRTALGTAKMRAELRWARCRNVSQALLLWVCLAIAKIRTKPAAGTTGALTPPWIGMMNGKGAHQQPCHSRPRRRSQCQVQFQRRRPCRFRRRLPCRSSPRRRRTSIQQHIRRRLRRQQRRIQQSIRQHLAPRRPCRSPHHRLSAAGTTAAWA